MRTAARSSAHGAGTGGAAMRRALNTPRRARGGAGAPGEVDGRAVEQVRESWLVEDRWWTERPLRRRYWEVLSAGGRNTVVFHDLLARPAGGRARGADGAGWFTQGA